MKSLEQPIVCRCNVCDNVVTIERWSYYTRKTGELEFGYLRCPFCGAAYLKNVTDQKVRKLLRNPKATAREKKSAVRALTEKYRPRFAELVEDAYTP